MASDDITFEILADGTIKVTTDKISSANHMTADKFLNFIAQHAGGEVTKQKRGNVHGHEHEHEHEHVTHKH